MNESGVKKVYKVSVRKVYEVGVKKSGFIKKEGSELEVRMPETYKGEAFLHHRPITVDDVIPRIILGQDGAFIERIVAEGFPAAKPTVEVVL